MNIYATKFFAACPNNGVRIEYELSIETTQVLSVEEILAAIDHHSVMIKTTRVQNG